MTRIVIADDQAAYRIGLRALLSTLGDVEVVGEAADGNEVVAVCARTVPDVVLMDVRMPVKDGIAATRDLAARVPTAKVLVLTTFDDDELVRSAIAAGARGYVLKDTPAEDLGDLIALTRRGYSTFGRGLIADTDATARAVTRDRSQLAALTARELDVLRELAVGASNKRIATTLGIADGTVRNYVTRILAHLGLSSRTEAALVARSILDLP